MRARTVVDMSASFVSFRSRRGTTADAVRSPPSVAHRRVGAPPDLSGAELPRHHVMTRSSPVGCMPDAEFPRHVMAGKLARQARRSTRASTGSVGKSVMSEPTGSWSESATERDPVLAQDQGQGQHRLDHREVLADAGARAAAERHPRVAVRGLGAVPVPVKRLGSNTSGSTQKSGWRWIVHGTTTTLRARRDPVAHQLVLLHGQPAHDRRRRVEPHGLLEHRRRQRQGGDRRPRSGAGRRAPRAPRRARRPGRPGGGRAGAGRRSARWPWSRARRA